MLLCLHRWTLAVESVDSAIHLPRVHLRHSPIPCCFFFLCDSRNYHYLGVVDELNHVECHDLNNRATGSNVLLPQLNPTIYMKDYH